MAWLLANSTSGAQGVQEPPYLDFGFVSWSGRKQAASLILICALTDGFEAPEVFLYC